MKNVSFVLLLFLTNTIIYSQNKSIEEKIDQLYENISENDPGYMIGIIKGEELLFEKGYGSANLEYQLPINSKSTFNIASLSKQFTGACIAKLIIEEKLSLEDEVAKYIEGFPFEKSGMQVKHLIYMTSGINDYYYNPRSNGTDWSSLNYFDIDTAIIASFNSKELMYEPGGQWSYSNVNYMLLTKIVEKISGQQFSKYMEEEIFHALGMNNSYVNDDLFQIIPHRVNGYNKRDKENTDWLKEEGYLKTEKEGYLQINRNSPHYGGSGIYMSLIDLKKWVVNFESKAFGGADFYNLLHKRMKFDHDKSNDAFGLAYGDFNGVEIVWYEGGDWGFSNYLMRFPELGITIICLSNLGTGNARKYVNEIADILIAAEILNLD